MLEAEWLTAREAQQHAAVAVLVCQSVLEIVEADAEKLQTPEAIEAASRERNGLQAAERELADSTTAAEVLATEAAAAKSRAAAATSSASFATRLASKAESEKAATAAAAAVAAAAATAAAATARAAALESSASERILAKKAAAATATEAAAAAASPSFLAVSKPKLSDSLIGREAVDSEGFRGRIVSIFLPVKMVSLKPSAGKHKTVKYELVDVLPPQPPCLPPPAEEPGFGEHLPLLPPAGEPGIGSHSAASHPGDLAFSDLAELVGGWAAVSSQDVADCDAGMIGKIVKVDAENEILSLESEKGKVKRFSFKQLTYLGPAKVTFPGVILKKQMRLLVADKVKRARENWSFTFEETEAGELVPISRETFLEASELEAGAFEILFRLLPPRVVCLPPWLTNIVAAQLASEAKGGVVEEASISAKFHDYLNRAELAVIPVFSLGKLSGQQLDELPGGHWTLLVAERLGSAAQASTESGSLGSTHDQPSHDSQTISK